MRLTFALLLFWIWRNSADSLTFQKKVKDYSINDILFIENPESIEKNVGALKKYVSSLLRSTIRRIYPREMSFPPPF